MLTCKMYEKILTKNCNKSKTPTPHFCLGKNMNIFLTRFFR